MAPVASSRSPSVRSKSQPQGANSKLVSSCGSCKGRSSGRRRGKTSGVGTQGLEQDDDAEEEGCQTASEQTGALDEAPCDLPQPRLPIEELPVDVLHRCGWGGS